MKKITLLFLCMLCSVLAGHAQSIVIGTGTAVTTTTESDPIDGYFNSFRYQVVYTAAELSASLTPYDEITALGWSIAGDYGGGPLLGYTIKIGHTSATNSAVHDVSETQVVKAAFDYDPTVTAVGVFDMITFDTNFVWNGVDNILVEICSEGPNDFVSPYGEVRTTALANGSRRYRVDGDTACGVNTNTANANKPNIQFNYVDGTPPTDTLDYYNLQFPATGSISILGDFDVYAQAYEAGLTDVTTGQSAGIQAWIGYSASNTNPSTAGWTWVPASFLGEVGNNDEYTLNLGSAIPVPGTFYYASRWSLNGAPYTYGGIQADASYGGVWGEDNNISGVLTINGVPNDACSGANVVNTLPYNFSQTDGIGSTNNDGFITVCTDGMNDGLWYTFTPDTDGTVDIALTNVTSTFDPQMNLYSGSCDALVCEITTDDGLDGGDETLTAYAVTAGVQYFVNVGDYGVNTDDAEGNFDIQVTGTFTLSVNDVINANAFTYFPNPVKNTLNLKAQSNIQNVSIYNMLGQEVSKIAPNSLNSEINMNQLNGGAYFVKVTINDVVETIRIIKQ